MSDLIASVAGVLLSLAASYIPGVSTRFAALQPDQRRFVMLLALLVASVGVFGASCAGLFDVVACSRDGGVTIARAFIWAMVANQSAYAITPGVTKK